MQPRINGRFAKHTKPLKERMEQKIDKTEECWEWTGARNERGYSNVWVNGKCRRAYRVYYELVVGEIEAGYELDHLCENTACIRPSHLEPVSHRENITRHFRRKKTGVSLDRLKEKQSE